mgnify:FL=1
MTKLITKDTEILSQRFGFRTTDEFVRAAVAEKIRTLRARLFARTAERVRRGLARRRSSERALLRDFERSRRA